MLATSREPLRVPGEVTWRVPSLSLPRLVPGAPAEESLEAESVRLFATRAAQAAPGFELDGDNADAVASLFATASTGCRWRSSWRRRG